MKHVIVLEDIIALALAAIIYRTKTHESPHFRGDSYWPNFVDK